MSNTNLELALPEWVLEFVTAEAERRGVTPGALATLWFIDRIDNEIQYAKSRKS